MAPGEDRRVASPFVLRALSNPIRLRLLEAATKQPGRGCSVSGMRDALAHESNVRLEAGAVHYHLRRLEEAGLLPRPIGV